MIRLVCCLCMFISSLFVSAQENKKPFVIVLGTAQDGGYPHMGCTKQCCERVWKNPANRRHVVSLALVDPSEHKWWLFEATPDIKDQLQSFRKLTKAAYAYLPDGIFITHAHIGHYTGLMQLGREVMNTKNIPVYVCAKMKEFLENNGPWSQLTKLHNISIYELQPDIPFICAPGINITALLVPHRDEYSETVGFKIKTNARSYLFIPDINKWQKWNKGIVSEVADVDVAMLDATFYDNTELGKINISEVPHPLVTETMDLFKNGDKDLKPKVHFIHINHTNPLLWNNTKRKEVMQAGFNICYEGQML